VRCDGQDLAGALPWYTDADNDGERRSRLDLWISGTGYDGYKGAVFVMSITER
jgi:hypothetical protein